MFATMADTSFAPHLESSTDDKHIIKMVKKCGEKQIRETHI